MDKDKGHDQAMRDAATITRLEKENAQLHEILRVSDEPRKALAALLNLAGLDNLKIGKWYIYRCSSGLADAIYKDEMDTEPDGKVKSISWALRSRGSEEFNYVLNRNVRRMAEGRRRNG